MSLQQRGGRVAVTAERRRISVIPWANISYDSSAVIRVLSVHGCCQPHSCQGEAAGLSMALWLIQWDSQGGDDVYGAVKMERNLLL